MWIFLLTANLDPCPVFYATPSILIENGKRYSTDEEICEFLNNYYRNIAIEIEKSLDKSKNNYLHYLNKSKQSEETFQLQNTTENEIIKAIGSLANKSSEGPDGLSNKIIKKISPWIIKDLLICINKSFEEKRFPDKLKISKLTPVFNSRRLSQ